MHNHRVVRFLTRGFMGCCWIMAGCKSAPPEPAFTLPPASATGANTLGFVVDGRTWINYGPICQGGGLFGGGPCHDNELLVSVFPTSKGFRELRLTAFLATDQHNESFSLDVDSVRGPGIYKSGPLATNGVYIPNSLTLTDAKVTDQTKGYYASITPNTTRIVLTKVDTIQHIIAGTFEGRLDLTAHPGTFVSITQGRFDVTYQP
jgi:hypothetical protein